MAPDWLVPQLAMHAEAVCGLVTVDDGACTRRTCRAASSHVPATARTSACSRRQPGRLLRRLSACRRVSPASCPRRRRPDPAVDGTRRSSRVAAREAACVADLPIASPCWPPLRSVSNSQFVRSFGSFPPFAANSCISRFCSHMFMAAESFISPCKLLDTKLVLC